MFGRYLIEIELHKTALRRRHLSRLKTRWSVSFPLSSEIPQRIILDASNRGQILLKTRNIFGWAVSLYVINHTYPAKPDSKKIVNGLKDHHLVHTEI